MGVIPLFTTRCPTQPCYLTRIKEKMAFFTPPKGKKESRGDGGVVGRRAGDCDESSRSCSLPLDKGSLLHCFSLMHRSLSPESLESVPYSLGSFYFH